jgi:glycosyltransferase involved in cell wall biosynthesis
VISFIVPAHNEEALLDGTLRALRAAADTMHPRESYEIVVVDDASTDRTPAIATAHGAIVVSAEVRQIAAARNAGARRAQGDRFIFVDADTILPAATLRAAVAALDAGAVGGGAGIEVDPGPPSWGPPLMRAVSRLMRMCRWAAGCFVFARRDVFERVGGFDERYFASEEIHLSRAMKRQGRFVILRECVVTSNRKARLLTPIQLAAQFARAARPAALKSRERLPMWYGGYREKRKE